MSNCKRQAEIYSRLEQGKFHDALLLAEELHLQQSHQVGQLVDYVNILLKMNYLDKAELVLREFPGPSENPNTFFLRCDLFIRRGDLESLKQLQKQYPQYSRTFSTIDVEASSTEKQNEDIDQLYFQEQLLGLLTFIIDRYPDCRLASKKAYVKMSSGFLDEGIKLLKQLAYETDNSQVGYLLLAEIALTQRDYPSARHKLEKLLNNFPEKWLILNRLGDIELALGNPGEAVDFYMKAMKLNPNDLNTNLDLIRSYLQNEERPKAIKIFNQAVQRFGKKNLSSIQSEIKSKKSNKVRLVKGLVWFEGGGDLLNIEFDSAQGNGDIHPIGNIGYEIVSSLQIARRLARNPVSRSNSQRYNLDVTVNFPECIVYKDGPSAGLALFAGMRAEYIGKRVSKSVALTGEVTLSGRVMPVGGIPGKLVAAYMNGIQTVYLPKTNLSDLRGVPETAKSNMRIRLVSHVDDLPGEIWVS
jgi:tetratricopeptide (TPR) repeat protein